MRALNGIELGSVAGGLSWEEGWGVGWGGGGGGGGGDGATYVTFEPVTIVAARDWCGTASFPAPEAPLGNDFSKICRSHDLCIDDQIAREICDAQMKQAMDFACSTNGNFACSAAATIYGLAISVGTFFDNLEKAKWVVGNPMGDGWGGGPPP